MASEEAAKGGVFPREFLKRIPKTDLHVHLDGSLRVSTLLELAEKDGLLAQLPYHTEAELRQHVFKERMESLVEYLECFKYTTMVLQRPENLERVAYEFAEDNFAEGVRYFEVRLAPQLHARLGLGADEEEMDMCSVLRSVNSGLKRATDEWNARLKARSRSASRLGVGGGDDGGGGADGVVFDGVGGSVGADDPDGENDHDEPSYRYGIIVSALRMFTADMSEYYRSLMHCHKHEPASRIYGLASMALITAAADLRVREGLPIVALDIAGAEGGFPARDHLDAFSFAHKNFIRTTCHAGESYGPTSIFQAITELKADRIGHGFHIFSDDVRPTDRSTCTSYCNTAIGSTSEDGRRAYRSSVCFATRSKRRRGVALGGLCGWLKLRIGQ
jgi:adenosine deaminase